MPSGRLLSSQITLIGVVESSTQTLDSALFDKFFSYLTEDGEEEQQIIISDVKMVEPSAASFESPMLTKDLAGSKNKKFL